MLKSNALLVYQLCKKTQQDLIDGKTIDPHQLAHLMGYISGQVYWYLEDDEKDEVKGGQGE